MSTSAKRSQRILRDAKERENPAAVTKSSAAFFPFVRRNEQGSFASRVESVYRLVDTLHEPVGLSISGIFKRREINLKKIERQV